LSLLDHFHLLHISLQAHFYTTIQYIQPIQAMPPSTHRPQLSHDSTLESLSVLLTQLYTLHLLLPSHSTSNLEILQPPHSLSPAIISAWQKAGMSDVVIETLKRLPYLSETMGSKASARSEGRGTREIAPDTLALDYLNEDNDAVEVWKDPFCLTRTEEASTETETELERGGSEEMREERRGGETKQQGGYLNNAIPLTSCIGVEGCLLLLDLDSSTYISTSQFPFSFSSLTLPLSLLLPANTASSPFSRSRFETNEKKAA
jgi:hypothetical protein